MEELLGILGFSLGASLGAGVVRAVGGGGEPLLRETLKAGIAVTETARGAVERAGGAIAGATAGVREGLEDLRAEVIAEREAERTGRPGRAEPTRIEIVRD